MGLGTGWVTRHEYCRQDPYFIPSFFLELVLSLLSGFIFKCIEKHFRPYFGCSIKKKNTNRAVLMETIKLQAVVIRAKTLIFCFIGAK